MNLISVTLGNTAGASSAWETIATGLTTALVGGIILFLLNWLREYLTKRWDRQADAEVLAFSLATDLDTIISGCFEVVTDRRYQDTTGIWHSTAEYPSVTYSDGLKWSAFPKGLHYRIRNLPNKIDAAMKSCSFEADHGDGAPDYYDFFRAREEHFSWIGMEAVVLREELSSTYGVPMINRGEWQPDQVFASKFFYHAEKRELSRIAASISPWPTPFEELQKRHVELANAIEAARAKQRS